MHATAGDADDYVNATSALQDFGVALVSLIGELLRDANVNIHSVDFRVKQKASASRKISGAGDRYADYADLHDLLGVRVITYFADEVDAAAAALVPEFDVDAANSVDKRAVLDPDRFGYLSLHYVAALSGRRSNLVEYKRFDGRKFELQIRSILQHAWAEIEHDLGYKATGSVPKETRRRFSRLAGLLELADDEFQRLRVDLAQYEDAVKAEINTGAGDLEVDQSTIYALIESGLFDDLSEGIAEIFPATVALRTPRVSVARMSEELTRLGVSRVEAVKSLVGDWAPYALSFARRWLADRPSGRSDSHRTVSRGIGLFYLVYALAAASDETVRSQWAASRMHADSTSLESRVLEVWKSVVDELGPPPSIPR
ncbi:MAG: hypothetical protein ABW025_04225 [Cellulomonas sp.]